MAYAARRVGVFLVTVVLASVAVFAILAVLPGDPASIYAGTQATPGQVEALREEYGLDALGARALRRLGAGRSSPATSATRSCRSGRSPTRSAAGCR